MKPSIPKQPPSTTAFILLPLALLLGFVYFFLFPFAKELKLQSLTTTCRRSTFANLTEKTIAPKPDFRLFMGILTHPDHYERRHLLRLVYSLQPKLATAHVDIRFVFCNLTKEDQRVLVALEIIRYDDILILNCTENMDRGKTYAYFSALPKLFNTTAGDADRPYDYVMKADDDIYFRLGRLAQSLKKMPRRDLYYGCAVPCDRVDPYRHYMSGMGYVLSWDLVEWISTSEITRNRTVGPEDFTTWTWLRDGSRANDQFDTKPAMYNYPSGDPCAHDLVPDTIAVHQLKDNLRWARTLKYFKVTDGLKPSKLYRIS